MKSHFEEEFEYIEKPEFVLSAHKKTLFTHLQREMNTYPIKEKEGINMFKRFINPKLLIPITIVLLVAVASLYSLNFKTTAYYVTLKINPSIEIELDRDSRVIETTALNEDARILLSSLELNNKEIDEAFEEIIKEANRLGYVALDKQFEVSVRDAQNNTATLDVSEILANIETSMVNTLKTEGLSNTVNVVAITNEQYTTATEIGIPTSDYLKLAELNVTDEAILNVIEYASTQMLGDDFDDDFDDIAEVWIYMLKAGVSQEQAQAIIRLALTSEETLDEIDDIARAYRSLVRSGMRETEAYTKLVSIIANDPSLDTLDDFIDDEDVDMMTGATYDDNDDDVDMMTGATYDDDDDDNDDDEDDDDEDDEDDDDEDDDDEDDDDEDDDDEDDDDND